MAKLKKYNIEGQEAGEAEVSDALAKAEANSQSVKDYIVAIRQNKRQWSACTKDRSEVSHSGQKPHKQKGLGRARQGSLAAAQYRGGGVVFGPQPKHNQHVRINRKERRLATKALLGEKIREQRLFVLEDPSFDAPATKRVAGFLKAVGLTGRVLFVGDGKDFAKSTKNLPKADFRTAANISGYDLTRARDIVVTQSALNELQKG